MDIPRRGARGSSDCRRGDADCGLSDAGGRDRSLCAAPASPSGSGTNICLCRARSTYGVSCSICFVQRICASAYFRLRFEPAVRLDRGLLSVPAGGDTGRVRVCPDARRGVQRGDFCVMASSSFGAGICV